MDVTSYLLGKKAGGGSTPTLQSKEVEITENGTQTVTPDTGYDGLSNVEVTTNVSGGADLNEYFNTEITANSFSTNTGFKYLKKVPTFTIGNNLNTYAYMFYNKDELAGAIKLKGGNSSKTIWGTENMFYNCANITSVDFSEMNDVTISNGGQKCESMFNQCYAITSIIGLNKFNVTNILNFARAFYFCNKLTELDLSGWTSSPTNIQYMFNNCSRLQKLDIRGFNFSNITSYTMAFNNVPAACEIIVADDTAKAWLNTNFSTLTNVKTVAEYEAEQNA